MQGRRSEVTPAAVRSMAQQPAVDDDLGMRWAIAWYEGIQSYRRRNDHVAA
jgi:hypothetical protein